MKSTFIFYKRPVRAKLGIALLIISSMCFNFDLLFKQTYSYYYYYYNRVNEFSLLNERFQKVIDVLPKNGVVGYISEKKPLEEDLEQQKDWFHKSYLEHFYKVQYVFSPLIIENKSNLSVVIGDFYSEALPDIPELQKLAVVQDFGKGVILFERKDQR